MTRTRKRKAGVEGIVTTMSRNGYKLEDAPKDWLRWAQPIELYVIRKLIPIDHWFEERHPSDRGEEPWLEVLDEEDDNTVYQVISSMIRPATRKTQGLLDAKKMVVQIDPMRNPDAKPEDLALAGRVLTDVLKQNMLRYVANRMNELVRLVMLRGMYVRQHEIVDQLSDEEYKGTCAIRHTVHDIFDVRWDIGPDLGVRAVILRKTITWNMLTTAMKKKLDLDSEPPWNRSLRCFEVWTETQHGVLIDGKVAKAMELHGYDFCPFTVAMHQASPVRMNMEPPRTGEWSGNVAQYVGRPVCEDLLLPSEFDSRLMTAMFENVKRMAVNPIIAKGLMLREDEDVLDAIRDGLLQLEDTVTSDAHYLTAPDGVSNGLRLLEQYDKRQTDVAGASPEQYSGQVKDRTSSVAASEMTSWTRAAAEAVRSTISDEAERAALMDAAMLGKYYKPSQKRQVEHDHPDLVASMGSDILNLDETDGDEFPDAAVIGGPGTVIDGLTFHGIREIEVKIPPTMLFSVEQGHNVGLQFANLPPGKGLLSRRSILERYIQVDDVDAEMTQVYAEDLQADPGLPISKLLNLQAWVKTQAITLGQKYVAEVDMEIAQAIPEAIKQSIKSIVTQFMPAPDLPGNDPLAQAQAGAPPPGGPPPPDGGAPLPDPNGPPPGPMQPPPPMPGAPQGGMPPPAPPPAPPGMLPNGFPPQALGNGGSP